MPRSRRIRGESETADERPAPGPIRVERSRTVRWSERPENWTSARLVQELGKRGIKVSSSFKKSDLLQLFKDNCQRPVEEGRPVLPRTEETVPVTVGQVDDVTELATGIPNANNMAAPEAATGTAAQMNAFRTEIGQLRGVVDALLQQISRNGDNSNVSANARSATATNVNELAMENVSAPTVLNSRGIPRSQCPPVVTVRESLKTQIIQGKYVNLALLLNPSYEQKGSHTIELGGQSLVFKAQSEDNRLNRNLSYDEFMEAFIIYKEIMCKAHPQRRLELDDYEKLITKMYRDYGGSGFYTYHVRFAKECATLFEEDGIKVDWSHRDPEIFSSVFAGYRMLSCSYCGSVEHRNVDCNTDRIKRSNSTRTAGATMNRTGTDVRGRPNVKYQGKEICNNFNEENGCRRPSCLRAHVCLSCYGQHAQSNCSKASRFQKDNVELGNFSRTPNENRNWKQ